MPALSNLAQQDLLLTKLALGYSNDFTQFVGDKIAPTIDVSKREGKYLSYNNAALVDQRGVMNVGRHSIPSLMDFDLSSTTFELKDKAWGTSVSELEKEVMNPQFINLQQEKTKLLVEADKLAMELEIAEEVQDDGNYDASNHIVCDGTAGKYYWDDYTNGDPIANIQTGIDAIMDDINKMPDTIIFSYDSVRAMADNDDVRKLGIGSRVSGNEMPMSVPQAAKMVADFVGIKNVYIGMGKYASAVAGTFSDIWSETCVIAHVGNMASRFEQNFACVLRLQGYPKIFKEMVARTDGLMEIRYRTAWDFHSINWNAGYLIKNTLT